MDLRKQMLEDFEKLVLEDFGKTFIVIRNGKSLHELEAISVNKRLLLRVDADIEKGDVLENKSYNLQYAITWLEYDAYKTNLIARYKLG